VSLKGLIFDIKRFSVNDGPGIRTTIFFKGCPLSCWWCHNPESRVCHVEKISRVRMLAGKEHHKDESIGTYVSVEEIMQEIVKEDIFHETSGGGVTFSGGEPLMQPEFLTALADGCRSRNIHTCLDTTGYCETELFKAFIPKIDLFLYDIKTLNRENHIRYTGIPPDLIIANLHQLSQSGSKFSIRIPVIPGINDDMENIGMIVNLLHGMEHLPEEVHLLPYHPLGKNKLRKMGMEDKMGCIPAPGDAELHKLATVFERIGLKVKKGG
jgi:pyruvate formate lyase activating enzyme